MKIFPHWSSHALLLAVAIFDGIALAVTNVSIDGAELGATAYMWAALVVIAIAIGRMRFEKPVAIAARDRLTTLLLGLAFLSAGWDVIRLLDHLSFRLTAALPYADELLSPTGDIWLAYFHLVQSQPWAALALQFSYTSLSFLSLTAFALLAGFGGQTRLGFFLEAFFVCAIACTAIGAFFPARGAVVTYLGSNADFRGFSSPPGLWFQAPLEALRAQVPITLHLGELPGLVTFPSFHTAAAIILAASFRGTIFFLPATACSAVIIAATPIFGGHFFIDLAGGAVAAFAVMAVLRRTERYAEMSSCVSARRHRSVKARDMLSSIGLTR